jgi:hypothetical protein
MMIVGMTPVEINKKYSIQVESILWVICKRDMSFVIVDEEDTLNDLGNLYSEQGKLKKAE